MKQLHRSDGAGGVVPPAPLEALPAQFRGAAAPSPANDDRRPAHQRRPAGASALSLGEERDQRRQAVYAIRLVDPEGRPGRLLAATHEGSEIVAIWRALAETLDLPLALRDRWGRLHPVTIRLGTASFPRRRGSALSGRRPRFLVRRKPPLARVG